MEHRVTIGDKAPFAGEARPSDQRSGPTSALQRTILWGTAILLLYFAAAAWFNPFQFSVLAGDDLRAFDTGRHGFAAVSQGLASIHKFRPVTALALSTAARWTNLDYDSIAALGLMIHTINGVLFFLLLHRTLELPLGTSAGLTVLAIFNRFAAYLFLQEQAIMEGLGVAVLIGCLMLAFGFLRKPAVLYGAMLGVLFAVLIHIHERYLVFAAPLVLLAATNLKAAPRAALALAGAVVLALLANLGLKHFWLQTPILVGTTTTPIEFDFAQICTFLWRGALNLIGINSGPAYLSLEDFPDSPGWVRAISLATAALSLLVLGAAVAGAYRRGPAAARLARHAPMIFCLSAIAALLLSASVTFRQEYRWIYPAFLVFLLVLAHQVYASHVRRRWFDAALAALLLLSMLRETYLSRWHHRYSGFEAYQVANELFETLDHIPDVKQHDVIVVRGDLPSKEWIFMEGTFSELYRLPALEFVDRDARLEQNDGRRIVLAYTSAARLFSIDHGQASTPALYRRADYSVVAEAAGKFEPSDRWATPTKTPMFPMTKSGVPALIAVAPIEVAIPKPEHAQNLNVSFSHVYRLGDGADVEITATTANGPVTLLSRLVPPLKDEDQPVWRKYELPLPPHTSEVLLRVWSKTDPTADWIALRDFSFE